MKKTDKKTPEKKDLCLDFWKGLKPKPLLTPNKSTPDPNSLHPSTRYKAQYFLVCPPFWVTSLHFESNYRIQGTCDLHFRSISMYIRYSHGNKQKQKKTKNKLHFQNVSRIVLFGGMKHKVKISPDLMFSFISVLFITLYLF